MSEENQLSVNLLPTSAVVIRRKLSTFGLIRKVLVAVIILACLTGVAVWSSAVVISRQLKVEEEKFKLLQDKIVQTSKKEQQFFLLSQRLSQIVSVLNSRDPIEVKLDTATKEFPAEITISSAKINSGSKTIGLSLSTPTFEGLNKMLSVLNNPEFSFVQISNFSRGDDGSYSALLEINLK